MVSNNGGSSSYAIDFGTSNTAIARWNPLTSQGELVRLPGLSQSISTQPPLIPSLLYIEDGIAGKTITGQRVRDRGLDLNSDPRFFRSFKRGIGTKLQGFLPQLDGQNISFEQVGTWFLQDLINNLRGETPENLDSLVLTVPVDSFESYRHWLIGVCDSLEVEQIRILDEPTAAALGYGAENQGLVLVLDFGGGTIDLSLVQLSRQKTETRGYLIKWGKKLLEENSPQQKNIARVIAKAGDNLGGADIDNWLMDYFSESQNLPKSTLTNRLAERLKIKLTATVEAKEVYFNDETLESYQLELDREHFNQILQEHKFFTRLDDLMTQTLQQARRNGVEKTDIDSVLLVGGSIQIPAVQDWVKKYFDEDRIKKKSYFEAISTGALQVSQNLEIQDFLYHSYGIRYWNRQTNSHDWHPLIKTGQPYPSNNPVELVLGASTSEQSKVELVIGELGTETSTTEVYFDGDLLVTRTGSNTSKSVQPLNEGEGARTIAQLDPLGNPGSDRLRLLFTVDTQRYLRITVEDLLTQKTLLNNYTVVQLN